MRPDAKSFNKTVMDRLQSSGPPVATYGGWYADFVSLPGEIVRAIFGAAGQNLHSFLSEMDLDHPDLHNNVEERIFNCHSSQTLGAMVGLIKLAIDAKRTDLLPPMSEIEFIPRDLYEQASSGSYIRCLKSPEARQEYRKSKKSQSVDMSTFSRKGEELWSIQPASFHSLSRYEMAYAAEIESAKKRARRFSDLGCVSMAAEISKSVELFEAQITDSYLGFNRLTFNSALVVLAKWHQYQLSTPHVLSAWPLERNYRIVIPGRYFAEFDFFEKPDENTLCWNYSPRIYPLADLEPLTPDMKEIVGVCESHGLFGGKPLFDHYVVMLPGVDYPPLRDKCHSFRSDTGSIVSYDDYNAARNALDRTLLHAGAFSGVLMGERDGKCYFISVWS